MYFFAGLGDGVQENRSTRKVMLSPNLFDRMYSGAPVIFLHPGLAGFEHYIIRKHIVKRSIDALCLGKCGCLQLP